MNSFRLIWVKLGYTCSKSCGKKISVLTPMYSFFSFQVQHMKFKILKRKISQLTIKIFHDISDISASSFFVFFVNLIFFPYKMSYFYKLINENDSCVPHMPFYNNIFNQNLCYLNNAFRT